jgi:hypothetical protein
MEIRNSKLVDSDTSTFLTLDVARVHLFDGYLWQAEDINEITAIGSTFHAFEDPPTSSVAAITIADVSNDPEERDIASLEQEAVDEFDQVLRDAIESQMNITKWMSSKLNVSDGFKGLVTPYIVKRDGKDWQYIALRISYAGKKFAIIGMFDIAKQDPLARLIFGTIQSVSFQS